jgi:hypothetical protein
MIPFIVGLSSGLLLIALLLILKQYDKQLIYGLTLTGIAFLYIGFTWSDLSSLIITSIQGLAFLTLAYYGIKKSMYIFALGYFLHGIWDLVYDVFDKPGLIPPQYDVFCLTIDFVIGIYLLVLARQSNSSIKIIANP